MGAHLRFIRKKWVGCLPPRVALRFARGTEGAALVESAIVFPLLLMVGFVGVEFSYALYQKQVLTTGVRDAARYLARYGNIEADALLEAKAKNIVLFGHPAGALSGQGARLAYWATRTQDVVVGVDPLDPIAGSVTTGILRPPLCTSATSQPIVWRVTATAPLAGMFLARAFNLSSGTSLTASHHERCLGK